MRLRANPVPTRLKAALLQAVGAAPAAADLWTRLEAEMIVQVPAPPAAGAGMAGRNAMFPGQQMGGAKSGVGDGMGGMPGMAGGSPRFGPGGMMADAT